MSNPDPMLEPTPPLAQPVPGAAGGLVKLCLLIVFNHRFEDNLPKLDWLYRPRFEHIRYLMPFYRGDRPDVIPVYYSSFQFQGFFMEAWHRLRGEGFTHFLVCADDMVLHPSLTGENFLEKLRLGVHDGYCKHILTLADRSFAWFPTPSALVAVAGTNGVNWQRELPPDEVATANLAAKGFPRGRLSWRNLRGGGIRAKGFFQVLFYLVMRGLKRRRDGRTRLLDLPYPLMSGNSDIMVIPAAYMEKFSFYSAVLAAMGVFVEVAAPTALALACPRVQGEADTGGWVAKDYFLGCSGKPAYEAYCRQHGYDLETLLASFEPNTLLLHPVKLSQWHLPGPSVAAAA